MAIGIVSDSDFDRELNRANKSPIPELKPAQVIDIPKPGRSEGDNNVPDSIRNIIGEEAVTNGRASALAFAKMFGISESSTSAYTAGQTSTASPTKNEKLTKHLKEAKLRVANKARKRLDLALNAITEDKLNDAKITEVATVARYMSAIVKDMEEPNRVGNPGDLNLNGPSIVLYNPGFAKEERFDTVEVND